MRTTRPDSDMLANRVLQASYRVAVQLMPAHVNQTGPRKFTQPQIMAILVLKEFLSIDYRSVVDLIAKQAGLRAVLGLTKVPHWTTLQKAANRDKSSTV